MEHTTNYQLSLWEQDDRIMREDFNDNNAKLDAAIKAANDRIDTKADAAQMAAALAEKPFVIGTYTGNGKMEADGGQHIVLGFHPKFLIISGLMNNFISSSPYFAIFSDQQTCSYLQFTNDGFTIYDADDSQAPYQLLLNRNNRKYGYIAF